MAWDYLLRVYRYSTWKLRHGMGKEGRKADAKVYGSFALFLISISLVIYVLHYVLFRDMHHILIFFVHDLAFLPLDVLIITLVLERFLHWRESQVAKQKTYMAVGIFFSEIGTELLAHLREYDENWEQTSSLLQVSEKWTHHNFSDAKKYAKRLRPSLHVEGRRLQWLKQFLSSRRQFLLTIMGNPDLMERESFTHMLWSVLHLEVELSARSNLLDLPLADVRHLGHDLGRCYLHSIVQWLSYMRHLKAEMPHQFMLGLRISPFNDNRSLVIEQDDSVGSSSDSESFVTIGDNNNGGLSSGDEGFSSSGDVEGFAPPRAPVAPYDIWARWNEEQSSEGEDGDFVDLKDYDVHSSRNADRIGQHRRRHSDGSMDLSSDWGSSSSYSHSSRRSRRSGGSSRSSVSTGSNRNRRTRRSEQKKQNSRSSHISDASARLKHAMSQSFAEAENGSSTGSFSND